MPDAITRLNTALTGRYRIDRELGAGGMATVYLADDLRHHRRVALKVLRPELAVAVGADRFLSEIKTTANLQHPHILPLFDSGEADSLLFYTMPYVEGETLRDRLRREAPLRMDEAVGIVTDVAEALQVAHEQGIVHRDIKPSNILLSRGKALVADFGIARATSVSGDTRLTTTGSSLGTAGYMSPEQASGYDEVDQRADVYSLGCVLFEMLVGQPPYQGRSFVAILAKQATEPVPSMRTLRASIPLHLDRAVAMAMGKDPAERFDGMRAFVDALSSSPGHHAAAEPVTKTVLVLPFLNRSPDPDNEYFSDGLTDEVIADLSRLPALRVISRNSSMTLKGTNKDTPTLVRELGVTHLVTGTVRKAGTALRITTELVEARADVPIWSEKFSGDLDDVFGIQEEISRRIVSALEVRLSASEDRRVAERPIDDAVAYDCYLRARQVMYNWTPENLLRAIGLVDEAIRVVGESPLLLATKANMHWVQVNMHVVPPTEGLGRASELVERALAVDPEFYLAIYVRGLVAGLRGQPEAALVDVHRAHVMRPDDPNILQELIRFSIFTGLRDTMALVEKVVRIDPLSPFRHLEKAFISFIYGPRDEGAAHGRRLIESAPETSTLTVYGSWAIAQAGFPEEAAERLGRAGTAIGKNVHGAFAVFLQYCLEGKEEEALQIVTPEVEASLQNEAACLMLADGFALIGRVDDAIRRLRIAIEHGFINYPYLNQGDPFLEGVRSDPAFHRLMTDLRPRWESLLDWERTLPK